MKNKYNQTQSFFFGMYQENNFYIVTKLIIHWNTKLYWLELLQVTLNLPALHIWVLSKQWFKEWVSAKMTLKTTSMYFILWTAWNACEKGKWLAWDHIPRKWWIWNSTLWKKQRKKDKLNPDILFHLWNNFPKC